MNRALFLDRDGVINEDYGYVHKVEDFHFRNGIFDLCRAAQEAGFKIVVVTNQSGIGRGFYSADQFHLLNRHMLCTFMHKGIQVEKVYFCPFHPRHGLGHFQKRSFDRKPNPGMIIQACNDFNINPMASFLIGDKESDQLAAEKAGIRLFVNSSNKDWIQASLKTISLLS